MSRLRSHFHTCRFPRLLALLVGHLACGAALAHEGHGLWGSHWHATDVLGFVAIAGVMVAALWRSRK